MRQQCVPKQIIAAWVTFKYSWKTYVHVGKIRNSIMPGRKIDDNLHLQSLGLSGSTKPSLIITTWLILLYEGEVHLVFSEPPASVDFKPTTATLITALTTTSCTGVPRSPAVSFSFGNSTITHTTIQKWVVYSPDDPPGWWCWADATVILCSLLLVFLYVLGYLVEFLIEFGETLLHGLNRLVDGELQIIYNLQGQKLNELYTYSYSIHWPKALLKRKLFCWKR